jgi:ubiquinone/menaquinone biosynthesis C-methylase UbiE
VKNMPVPSSSQREYVNVYFREQSTFWKNIYTSSGVYAQIHQDRHAAALAWIDSLHLAPGSTALETGCGAGFMAVALAQRGWRVRAIDSTAAMIEQARQNAALSGQALSLEIDDVYALASEDDSFDLVVALGVLPWLERPELAIQEMARVTKPGGFVLFTADNMLRLNALLDPWYNPFLRPLKGAVKLVLERFGFHQRNAKNVGATFHSHRYIDRLLVRSGLSKIKSKTLGFGPFTLFKRAVLPESSGTRLHFRLQRLADAGVFPFRSTGAHYLVLARKSAAEVARL